jgi:hypothetical protein
VTAAVRPYPRRSARVRDVYLPGDAPQSAPAVEPAPARPLGRSHGRTGTGHPDQLTVCPCQWGATAHCLHGRHHACHAGTPTEHAETHLTYANGTCVLDQGHPIEVWPAGRACAWLCPCECHAQDTADPEPSTSRPQRVLTEDDLEVIRAVPALTFHKALILGLVDPVPNSSPMSEDEGAWVRAHAWPDHYRLLERGYPWGYWRWSTCERGTCWNCLGNRCDLCVHRQEGGPSVDDNFDWLHNHLGHAVARVIVRPDGAPCVWQCRCPCDKTTAPEEEAHPEPPPRREQPAPPPPAMPGGWEQPALPI